MQVFESKNKQDFPEFPGEAHFPGVRSEFVYVDAHLRPHKTAVDALDAIPGAPYALYRRIDREKYERSDLTPDYFIG